MRFLLLCLVLLSGTAHAAEELTIAAGAGYKKPLMALYQLFKERTGIEVAPMFGHMQAIVSQAESGGRVSVVVGDRALMSGELFESFLVLGEGKLVLVWTGAPPDEGYEALLDTRFSRIAQPDPMKAIYGRAASQFLERSGIGPQLGGRLLVTATVPQVSSYLVAKSVDAGFVNLTEALALSDRIGGYTPLPQEFYDPITIAAGVVKGHANDAGLREFIEFLGTPPAREILSAAGL